MLVRFTVPPGQNDVAPEAVIDAGLVEVPVITMSSMRNCGPAGVVVVTPVFLQRNLRFAVDGMLPVALLLYQLAVPVPVGRADASASGVYETPSVLYSITS